MNITSGIAEISMMNRAGGVDKIYTWPKLNQGKVLPVDRVARRAQNTHYIHKPNQEEKTKLLEKIKTESYGSYTQHGRKSSFGGTVAPGSFFAALA